MDTRTHKDQNVNGSTVKFIGKCPVTGINLYESNELGNCSNDPRGPLGKHAVTWFIASEYGMIGPDMAASWIACNNDERTYRKALELAKKEWKTLCK